MTSTTDNRTTELREKLNKLVIELDRLDIALDSPASDMTLGEYEQEREKLLDGFIQAIAATLGNGECRITASSTDGLTSDEPRHWFRLSCGHSFTVDGLDAPVACPVCGKAVKR